MLNFCVTPIKVCLSSEIRPTRDEASSSAYVLHTADIEIGFKIEFYKGLTFLCGNLSQTQIKDQLKVKK